MIIYGIQGNYGSGKTRPILLNDDEKLILLILVENALMINSQNIKKMGTYNIYQSLLSKLGKI